MRLSLEVRSDNLSNLSFYARYAHTAYGEPSDAALAPSGDALAVASHSPFRFKGYLFDGETGLYYLNARYYDPSSGRFASPDGFAYLDPWALGFGPNPYAYCGCSPLLFADWEGNDAIAATVGAALLLLIAIGALVVITIETQTHFLTNATAAFADAVCEIAESYVGQSIPLVFGSVSLGTFPTASEPFVASVEDSAVINVAQLTFSFSIQDPFARPGQKKQGREIKSKGRARFRDRIKFRRGRKPPKHHTPGRDHKKYVLAFLIQRLIDSDHRRRDDARFF